MKKGLLLLMVVLSIPRARAEESFAAKESNISLFGTYVDKAQEHWGGGVGLSYFLSTYIGVGAVTHWENFSGRFLDNAAGEIYLRAPMSRIPVAIYGVGGGGYNWDTEAQFESAGAGIEYRMKKDLGIFADVQWYWNKNAEDGLQARAGLRLSY